MSGAKTRNYNRLIIGQCVRLVHVSGTIDMLLIVHIVKYIEVNIKRINLIIMNIIIHDQYKEDKSEK